MNKTKIVATIGPASKDIEILRKLIKGGMDVVRLNLVHADYAFCKDIIKKVEALNEELGSNVAIMLDTKGPDIRTGDFVQGSAEFKKNDKIRIYMEEIIGDNTKFSINYPNLINDVVYNTTLKINDGKVELRVLDTIDNYILCEVLNDGVIEDHKGVNVPGVDLHRPFITPKDKEDMMFANKMNVDFIALSFVTSAEDVLEVNDMMIQLGNDHIGIIAKIENAKGLDDIDEIIRVADGVMIARGDLGSELPAERIPGIQKNIINKCHAAGKVSIVATEMMSSMENAATPTRAEVSDVANAVLDGADSVMLSGETTIGNYPVETVEMMTKIIESAEHDINYLDFLDRAMRTEKQDITGLISYSVAECANRLKCKAIVAPTLTGYTARKMSRFRPICLILALSPNKQTVRSLALHFGVHAIVVDELTSFDKIMKLATDTARKSLQANEGDKVIITGGYPFKDSRHTNFMQIEEL